MKLPESKRGFFERAQAEIERLLSADRAEVWLNDEETGELYTFVNSTGSDGDYVCLPNHLGMIGEVFSSGVTISIADAYADPRFNPHHDHSTGYRTLTLLGVQMRDGTGRPIGVVRAMNKRTDSFTADDVTLLIEYLKKTTTELSD